jgi:hypothetical protein
MLSNGINDPLGSRQSNAPAHHEKGASYQNREAEKISQVGHVSMSEKRRRRVDRRKGSRRCPRTFRSWLRDRRAGWIDPSAAPQKTGIRVGEHEWIICYLWREKRASGLTESRRPNSLNAQIANRIKAVSATEGGEGWMLLSERGNRNTAVNNAIFMPTRWKKSQRSPVRDYTKCNVVFIFQNDVNPPFGEINAFAFALTKDIDVADYVANNFNTAAPGFRYEAYETWLGLDAVSAVGLLSGLLSGLATSQAAYSYFKNVYLASTGNKDIDRKQGNFFMSESPRKKGYNSKQENPKTAQKVGGAATLLLFVKYLRQVCNTTAEGFANQKRQAEACELVQLIDLQKISVTDAILMWAAFVATL